MMASPEANPITAPTPSVMRRLSSWFYEGILLFGVIFIAGYLFGALSQTKHALDNRHGLQAFVFLVMALYFTWFWHKGQTLAMKTWHLRLVDRDGQPLTQQRALWRYVLSWMWLLPPLAIAHTGGFSSLQSVGLTTIWVMVWAGLSRLHPERQYWHDHWAGTRLIDARPIASPKSHEDLST